MTGFLLDTNVLSEYSHGKPPNANLRRWVDSQNENSLYLSVLTLGEIRKGIALLPDSKKQRDLAQWLDFDLPPRFHGRILPINNEIAQLWGAMTARAQRGGIVLPIIDGLIAATAAHHKLTLVTRNVKDFARLNLPVLNPWE